MTAFNNFLHKEHDGAKTVKRGGGREILSWEERIAERRYAQEPVGGLSPEQIYEKRWAAALLERVLARLREESLDARRSGLFDLLNATLGRGRGDVLRATGDAVRHDVAAIKVTVHRLRHRYREVLPEEIAQTVADPAEINGEIQYLIRLLSA